LDDPWQEEQNALWCISAYAEYLDRDLEWWEIDAILAVVETPQE
jgi:hypothetical protein